MGLKWLMTAKATNGDSRHVKIADKLALVTSSIVQFAASSSKLVALDGLIDR